MRVFDSIAALSSVCFFDKGVSLFISVSKSSCLNNFLHKLHQPIHVANSHRRELQLISFFCFNVDDGGILPENFQEGENLTKASGNAAYDDENPDAFRNFGFSLCSSFKKFHGSSRNGGMRPRRGCLEGNDTILKNRCQGISSVFLVGLFLMRYRIDRNDVRFFEILRRSTQSLVTQEILTAHVFFFERTGPEICYDGGGTDGPASVAEKLMGKPKSFRGLI